MSNVFPSGSSDSRESFLTAGIKLIAQYGIDKVTVAQVTSYCSLSRPTFYSYFGDLDGLFAEIWIRHGISWLNNLENVESQQTLEMEKMLSVSLTEILFASHRKIALSEVVRPMVNEWWASKALSNSLYGVRLAWILGIRLGVLAGQSLSDDMHLASEVVPLLTNMPLNEPDVDQKVGPTYVIELGSVSSNALDVNEHLKAAALEVVANAGVSGTSIARIARKVQLTSGSVYPRFGSVHELVTEAFKWGIGQIVKDNTQVYRQIAGGPSSYGSLISATLGQSRDVWRNFRQEMYMASRTSPDLSAAIESAVKESNRPLSVLLTEHGVPDSLNAQFVAVLHALGIGLAALKTAGVPVEHLDHSAPTRYLVQTAVGQQVELAGA